MIIVEAAATAPRSDWPVEARQTSSVQFAAFPISTQAEPGGTQEVILHVSGAEVSRLNVNVDAAPGDVAELPLPAITERTLE